MILDYTLAGLVTAGLLFYLTYALLTAITVSFISAGSTSYRLARNAVDAAQTDAAAEAAVNRGGLTILLIEHVMRAVMALASRVLVLHHGAAIAQGTPDAVVREPAVIASYLGAETV